MRGLLLASDPSAGRAGGCGGASPKPEGQRVLAAAIPTVNSHCLWWNSSGQAEKPLAGLCGGLAVAGAWEGEKAGMAGARELQQAG